MEPMLCATAQVVPEGDPNIAIEPKFDGWRGLLAKLADGSVAISTRTGKSIDTLPYVNDAFTNLPANTIIDGEIVDLVSDTERQWNRTQKLCSRKAVHVPTPEDPPLTYVVFDMLELNGQSLLARPLTERRQLLEALVALMPEGAPVQISPQFPVTQETFDKLVDSGWEGIVCKRLDSTYSPGARGPAWTKIKPEQEVDAVCVGTYAPEVGSKYEGRAVGGLMFEYEGKALKCGTGMDDALREDLLNNEDRYVGKVVVIAHAGIAPDTGALRFPSLKRFRDDADKAATDVRGVLNESGSTKGALLDRALQAEEERDEYKEKYEEAAARLGVVVKNKVTRGGARGSTGKRNYNSMGNEKLLASIGELRTMRGHAYEWVMTRSGDAPAELARAEEVARSRGMAI